MDSSDEKRDEKGDEKTHDATDQRTGDVLGLSGFASNDASGPHTSDDPEEVGKRRARMQEGADDLTTVKSDLPHGGGATGIDKGAGGEGTDIE